MAEEQFYPAEEQGIKKPKTSEEIKQDMEEGKKAENVYSEEGREKLVEDGEIEPHEDGFMEGAEGRGQKNCCAECGVNLGEEETKVIEREFDGDTKWFCSEEHAENYAKSHPEKENPERVEE